MSVHGRGEGGGEGEAYGMIGQTNVFSMLLYDNVTIQNCWHDFLRCLKNYWPRYTVIALWLSLNKCMK